MPTAKANPKRRSKKLSIFKEIEKNLRKIAETDSSMNVQFIAETLRFLWVHETSN